jgi:tRNA G18 (ribose-2'-O)-methylase SpoU
MRGYFGIGVEGISKEQNAGTIARTAHAFGAQFFYTVQPHIDIKAMRQSDTSGAFDHVPYHQYGSVDEMQLPKGCQLVGVELTEDAIELPSFRHPLRAAYVFGPEMGSLSPAMLERCALTVKIPMKFCVNVGVAAAIIMYDRQISMGRFPNRPTLPGGKLEPLPNHTQGHRRKTRTKKEAES